MTSKFLLNDGTSRILLNDGTSLLLLNPQTAQPGLVTNTQTFYAPTVAEVGLRLIATTQAHSTTGATYVVNLPSGLQQNDLVVVLGANPQLFGASGNDPGPTAGYTDIYADQAWSGSAGEVRAAYKFMGASPDTTVTCGNGDFVSNKASTVIIYVFRGADTSTPIDVAVPALATGSGTTADPPSITPVTNNSCIIAFTANSDTAANISAPSGYGTLVAEGVTNSQTAAIAAAIKFQSIAATEDPGTFDLVSSVSWGAGTIAIRSATPKSYLVPGLVDDSTDTFYAPTVANTLRILTPSLFTNVNQLAQAGSGDVAIDYRGAQLFADVDSNASGVLTYNAVDIGTAASDRLVVLWASGGYSGGSPAATPTVTIGGVTATDVATGGLLDGFWSSGVGGSWFYALVTSGTTATITFDAGDATTTWSAGDFEVYAVTGADASGNPVLDVDFVDGGTFPHDFTFDTNDNGGWVLGGLVSQSATTTPYLSYTEGSEDAELLVVETYDAAVAHAEVTTGESGHVVTVDYIADGDPTGVFYQTLFSFAPGSSGAGAYAPTVAHAGGGGSTLTPSFYDDSTDTFYAPLVSRRRVYPALYTNSQTFYVPLVSHSRVYPALVSNSQTFYAPTVSHSRVYPGLVTNSQTIYQPNATRIEDPSYYQNAQTFYAPLVSHSRVYPALYDDSTDTFYQPAVSRTRVYPGLYTNSQSFYAPLVLRTRIYPGLYDDSIDTFYSPSITTGSGQLSPQLVDDSADTFYAPTVHAGAVTLLPGLYSDTDTIYAPNLVRGIRPPLFSEATTADPARTHSGIDLSSDLLTATYTSSDFWYYNVPSTTTRRGKLCFAADVIVYDINDPSEDDCGVGVADTAWNPLTITDGVGGTQGGVHSAGTFGYGFYFNYPPTVADYSNIFTPGDRIIIAVDTLGKRIWWRQNSSDWNFDATADPATGVGGYDITGMGDDVYAMLSLGSLAGSPSFDFDFTPDAAEVPKGFRAWDEEPIPATVSRTRFYPGLYSNSQTFYTPVVSRTIYPGFYDDSTDTFYSPRAGKGTRPSFVDDSTDTFYSPTFVRVDHYEPSADSVDGAWTNEAGSQVNLYASIDEAPAAPSDSDYIRSEGFPHASACKVKISGSDDISANMKVRYRYAKVAQPEEVMALTVRLKQGAAVIAQWTDSDVSTSAQTVEQDLSSGELSSITDFTDLYLEFEADYTGA